VLRTIGSLVYKNGANLNEKNLNKLMDLLKNDKYAASCDRLQFRLLHSQLIYNISMPNPEFIGDTFKLSAVYHILQIFNANFEDLAKESSEEMQNTLSKVFSKGLESMENFFSSINHEANWFKSFELLDLFYLIRYFAQCGKSKKSFDRKYIDNLFRQINQTKEQNYEQLSKNRPKPQYFRGSNKQSKIVETVYVQNSAQTIRETQLPLVQYDNASLNTSTSSLNNSSNFSKEKLNAKIRIVAIGVLLTLFQKIDKRDILNSWEANTELTFSIRCDNSPKVT